MRLISIVVALAATSALGFAQARPYEGSDVHEIYNRLLPQIEKIPIFDHHAHPGFADDPDVDAMAAPPNYSSPLRERDSNPELVAASKALFGYPYDDMSPEHAKWLVEKKAQLRKEQGNAYWSNILDKLNIEEGVANRAMMPDYLAPKRFPWVFFSDSFMWPFNNEKEINRNPDEKVYIPLQEKMLHRWMDQENVKQLPASFDDYLKFITQTLEDNQKKGGIAQKFEVAYFRSMQQRPELLRNALRDRIHQPYRAPLCPLLPALEELDLSSGVLGVALSGAGPSVLVFLDPKSSPRKAARAIASHLKKHNLEAELLLTEIAPEGAVDAWRTRTKRI